VNLNEQVTFRMTEAGTRLWRAHIRELLLNEDAYVEDEYKWPLWEVMSFFGPHTFNGMPKPLIEGNALHLRDV
jgi:hypothetical protein